MANTLSATEMMDVLFQKPGRVSEGVRSRISPALRVRDAFQTCSVREAPGRAFGKKRQQLQITFYDSNYGLSRVADEHPRSFRKALMELRYIGFNIEQVNAINTKTIYGFWMFAFDTLRTMRVPLELELRARYGERVAGHWASKAFLGVAFTSKDDFGKIPLTNNIFSPEMEEMAYGHMVPHVENAIRKNPEIYTPSN